MGNRLAFPRRCALVCLAVMLAGASSQALATTCADICDSTSGACSIPDTEVVEPGSTLDCTGRDVTVTGSGTLTVTDGDFTLLANNLTVAGTSVQSGTITAVEGPDGIPGAIEIELTGSATIYGKIRANGQHGGGTISLTAAGNITIPEAGTDGIEAGGTGSGANGGEIRLEAGGFILIQDPIHAEGANSGDTAGGTIEITAGGDVTTDTHGHINAPGRSLGGGDITIVSENGDVLIREHVEVDGKSNGGGGGHIDIHAGGRIEIAEQMYARGGFQSGGGKAEAGSINLEAGCGGVAITASIYATGGSLGTGYDGGAINVESAGDLTVGAGVVLDTHALASGGEGGAVRLAARNLVSIANTATIDARGHATAPGRGGKVTMQACSVNVASGATINTTGNSGGQIQLGATKQAPATGTQPLVVGSAAVLKAKGATSATDGVIEAFPRNLKLGKCSNDGSRLCFVSAECTAGCQTGSCNYANPDTGGVSTQFDVAPDRDGDPSLTTCDATCE